jgi:hypothetical protein
LGGSADNEIYELATDVTVTGNSFSKPVTIGEIDYPMSGPSLDGNTCVLRAVDAGDSTDYPPGSSSGGNKTLAGLTAKPLTIHYG